jgi:predicted transcriptional regulator
MQKVKCQSLAKTKSEYIVMKMPSVCTKTGSAYIVLFHLQKNGARSGGIHQSLLWSILWKGVHMETVQIVLDKKLLLATDQAARRTRRNRSALVRDALREHLRRLEIREMEERDRAGYSNRAQARDESSLWEAEAVWPAE